MDVVIDWITGLGGLLGGLGALFVGIAALWPHIRTRRIRVWRLLPGIILLVISAGIFIAHAIPPEEQSQPIYQQHSRECENPDEYMVGQMIWRSNASGLRVHGQFGCEGSSPWPAKAGYVKYNTVELRSIDHLYLIVRYSKHSASTTPIEIYLDEEAQPRATFIPENQGNWDRFTETDPIDLGQITAGTHTIKFSTDGQQHGVADLDKFTYF